jgi:hypothetical protein
MARAEENATAQQQHASHQRALRSVMIALCAVACFAAFCGFVLNQQGAGKSAELESTQTWPVISTSTKASINAHNKLSSKSSLDEDAVDWAEEEVRLHIKIQYQNTKEYFAAAQLRVCGRITHHWFVTALLNVLYRQAENKLIAGLEVIFVCS